MELMQSNCIDNFNVSTLQCPHDDWFYITTCDPSILLSSATYIQRYDMVDIDLLFSLV